MKVLSKRIGDHDPEFVSLHTPRTHPEFVSPQHKETHVGRIAFSSPRADLKHNIEDTFEVPLPTSLMAGTEAKLRQVLEQPRQGGGLRIYVAGPMQGIKEFNFPAFHAAAKLLRSHGHEVFNPAERDLQRHDGIDISLGNETGDLTQAVETHGFSLRDALGDDTRYICAEANAIAMLPGWEASKGAKAEHALAFALGHLIIYLGGFYA